MHPLIHVFGLEIPAYSFCTVLAAAVAVVLALPALRRAGLNKARSAGLLAMMCVAFLIGARLWNVAVNPGNFAGSLKWYTPRLAGLSLYGGLFGAGLVVAASLPLWKKPIFPVLDAMTVPGGVSFCIARIGCFLNGCCGGRVTGCPLGIEFPVRDASRQLLREALPFLSSVNTVHPTQLYELAGAALGLPLVVLLVRRLHLRHGATFLLYSAWFSAVRLAVLPLRALTYPDAVKNIVYPLIYLIIIICGITLTLRRGRQTERNFG